MSTAVVDAPVVRASAWRDLAVLLKLRIGALVGHRRPPRDRLILCRRRVIDGRAGAAQAPVKIGTGQASSTARVTDVANRSRTG